MVENADCNKLLVVRLAFIGLVMLFDLVSFQRFEATSLLWSTFTLSLGALVSLWFDRRYLSQSISWLFALVTAFTALGVLSLFWAYSPAHAWESAQISLSAFAVLIIIFPTLHRSKDKINYLIIFILIALSTLALLSIETASSRMLLAPFIAVLESSNYALALLYGHWTGQRMMTLLNANVSAPLFLMGSMLCFYLRSHTRILAQRSILTGVAILMAMSFVLCVSVGATLVAILAGTLLVILCPRKQRTELVLFIVLVYLVGMLCAFAAYFFMGTGSAQSLIASIIALLCLPLGFGLERILTKACSLAGTLRCAVIVAILFATGALFLLTVSPIAPDVIPSFAQERFTGLLYNEFAQERLTAHRDALRIAKQAPLIGQGGGAFEARLMQVQDHYYESRYAHNHYLEVLTQTGIVGLLIFLTLLGRIFWLIFYDKNQGALRKSQDYDSFLLVLAFCFVVIMLHALIDFALSFLWFLVIFYLLIAILSANQEQALGRKLPRIYTPTTILSRSQRCTKLAITAIVLSCVGMMVFAALFSAGSLYAEKSFSQLEARQGLTLEQLNATTRRAVALDPFRALNYKLSYVDLLLDYDLSVQQRSLFDEYLISLEQATHKSVSAAQILAEYHYMKGDNQRARQHAKSILYIRPHDPDTQELVADLLEAIGKD